MLATLVAIAFLLLLSAFFSGSETALTAASRPLMHQLEHDGDRKAALVNRLRDDQESLIGAILLGNNLVNILASALATGILISLFGQAGIAYAAVGMTLLVLIFAEILPKTFALRTADRTAPAIAPLVNVVVALLSPFTKTIAVLVQGTLSLIGVRSRYANGSSTEAELRPAGRGESAGVAVHRGGAEQVGHG